MNQKSMIAVLATCASFVLIAAPKAPVALALPTEAERNPLKFPSRVETVTATFATAEDAQKAELRIAPLYRNAPLAFTTRWDDSNPAHVQRMEMFKRVGINGTFFLNGGEDYMKKDFAKIRALGGRAGNHTVSHPFLMESGINIIFPNVLENKIRIETNVGDPNTSFAIPYSWDSAIDKARVAKLARILLDTGLFVSSDWPLEGTLQPAWAWMPGHTFGANDSAPDEKRYNDGVAAGVKEIGLDPNYPKLTFGIHSWCQPAGLLKQEAWLKQTLKDHPDWWYTDDAHYGAYRYEFYHSSVRKLGVKGKVATFEVTRFDPAFLGAVQELTYDFGVAATKVESKGGYSEKDLPAKIDRMKDGVSAKFPDLKLTLKVDEAKGTLEYALDGAVEKIVRTMVWPAPMWEKSVIRSEKASAKLDLGKKNTTPEYQEGEHFYAVGVDFVKDGVRGRLYATESIKGPKGMKGATPRDTVLVLGPIQPADYDEEKWIKLSVPEATLPNLGETIDKYWRSMADKTRVGYSAAAYIPWEGREPQDFKAAVGAVKEPQIPFLATVDFEAPADGEMVLVYNFMSWKGEWFYLNGEKIQVTPKGRITIKVKKGMNRLIRRWFWEQPWIPKAYMLNISEDGSVEKMVKFHQSKIEPRAALFASEGFSTDFLPNGMPRKIVDGDNLLVEFEYLEGAGTKLLPTPSSKNVYTRDGGKSMTCVHDAPLGARGADFSAKSSCTITKDALDFSGNLQMREGLEWKGPVAMEKFFINVSHFVGKTAKFIDAKGKVTEVVFKPQYDKSIQIPGFKTVEFDGYRLTLGEGASVTQSFDRRQWGQPHIIFQVVPAGGLNWGKPVANSKPFAWSWKFERIAK